MVLHVDDEENGGVGFGSLNLVSNFLYEDFEVFETDMVGNSSLLKSR